MSSISQLRKLIEDRVEEQLPGHLITKGVEFHCRRGIREWCDCSYCETKRIGTNKIGNTPHFFKCARWDFNTNRWQSRRIDAEAYRKKQREKLRDLLDTLRQEVI